MAKLILKLNKLAGKHGVGTVQLLEDRLVELKNRGVYEHPAAHVIIEAHRNLEKYVSFNNKEGYGLNVNASAGFIEIYSLQMKLANQLKKK